MIKILHVFHRMDMGGAESLILNIYRNIDRTKFQFDFMVHTNEKGFFDEEIKKLGGNIYYMTRFSPFKIKQYKESWIDFLKYNDYNYIHCHISYSAIIIAKVAKKQGLKIIVHSHCMSAQGEYKSLNVRFKNSIVKLQQRDLNKYVYYKLACSVEAGKWLFGSSGVKKDNFILINNGIVLKDYAYSDEYRIKYREEFGVAKDSFIVGNVGRFAEQKNHLFLLEVFKEIRKRNEKAVLMLIGSGDLESKIRTRAKELRISKDVIFCGVRNDVSRILSTFDTFVFPSIREGFGISILEAEANGLRCFISDNIPASINVTNNVVFISLKETPDFWAEQILNNSGRDYQSIELIQTKGYDIIGVVETLEALYKGEYRC